MAATGKAYYLKFKNGVEGIAHIESNAGLRWLIEKKGLIGYKRLPEYKK